MATQQWRPLPWRPARGASSIGSCSRSFNRSAGSTFTRAAPRSSELFQPLIAEIQGVYSPYVSYNVITRISDLGDV